MAVATPSSKSAFTVVRAPPHSRVLPPSGSSSIAATGSHIHLSGHSHSSAHASSSKDAMDVDYDEDEQAALRGYMDGEAGSTAENFKVATAGEAIASASSLMRGHGAYLSSVEGDEGSAASIISSLCGTVTRTNRLISVSPVRCRYAPEVGDLVVGRITEVSAGQRRWKVDIASRQDAVLSLSSVNLPGGVQRRKLESDELQMRVFFQEKDLLVAEVQTAFQDGAVALHTRSLRYGKLRNGQLAIVQPVLIRRLKSHFVHLKRDDSVDLDLTIGLNGFIWVSKHSDYDATKAEQEQESASMSTGLAGRGVGMDIDGVYSDVNESIPPHTMQAIARVCYILALLSNAHIPISDVSVGRAFDVSVELAPVQGGGLTELICAQIRQEALKAIAR
ncbi:Exosomal 3'-5' exoribonuclease complex, subunit Rrp4 [Ceraceosorus bombacis]|uniref:Exosomal 3'-5' exoribonuclease complex, subunit Rrp4 n=1 Tax=Ceraceosorus bombacis TaxID=401625 RepID=A0A0N7LBI8_9BASI|nr:Exosomal 3'-5' exoribonuclease complex, subunit Rrp4 [Ceraceosorus bombacis]